MKKHEQQINVKVRVRIYTYEYLTMLRKHMSARRIRSMRHANEVSADNYQKYQKFLISLRCPVIHNSFEMIEQYLTDDGIFEEIKHNYTDYSQRFVLY